jgi:aspartate/methionine/tyrosine aminotransferase
MTVAGAGDAVLMTNPCYFNHESTLAMLGIGTRFVDCPASSGFLPDPEAVQAALTPEVRAFALVSPNNPTGCIYPAAMLDRLFEVCREAGVWMIVDETYRDFMEAEERHKLLRRDDWREGLIQLYSFSKSFCIPGHRLGAVVAGSRVIEGIAKVMDNLQICAPRAAQMAVARGIEPLADWREANRAEIGRRAVALRTTMADAPGWEIGAMGAYFAYVRHPFEGHGSVEVARMLAERAGVSCLPGAFFGEGQDGYLRIAFANADVDTIAQLGPRLREMGDA